MKGRCARWLPVRATHTAPSENGLPTSPIGSKRGVSPRVVVGSISEYLRLRSRARRRRDIDSRTRKPQPNPTIRQMRGSATRLSSCALAARYGKRRRNMSHVEYPGFTRCLQQVSANQIVFHLSVPTFSEVNGQEEMSGTGEDKMEPAFRTSLRGTPIEGPPRRQWKGFAFVVGHFCAAPDRYRAVD